MRDQKLANRILKNYFSCIRKVGVLIKKQESSWTGKWDSTFVVLTNAGFIYFESESLKEEKDLKPRNFKPLNDFVVTPVPPSVSLPLKFYTKLNFRKLAIEETSLNLSSRRTLSWLRTWLCKPQLSKIWLSGSELSDSTRLICSGHVAPSLSSGSSSKESKSQAATQLYMLANSSKTELTNRCLTSTWKKNKSSNC